MPGSPREITTPSQSIVKINLPIQSRTISATSISLLSSDIDKLKKFRLISLATKRVYYEMRESVLFFLTLLVFHEKNVPSGAGAKYVHFLANQC